MRYARQKEKMDCFPCSYINALKWSGINISYYKSRHKIYKKVNYNNGVWFQDVYKFLYKQKKFKLILKGSYSKIVKSLKDNKAVLFIFLKPNENLSHVCLITKENKNTFTAINYFRHQTISKINKDTIKKLSKGSIIYEVSRN
jgi:CO dehydrogenase/acetyl-CoA synthase beta subunit